MEAVGVAEKMESSPVISFPVSLFLSSEASLFS
jgi:hypothetical protein